MDGAARDRFRPERRPAACAVRARRRRRSAARFQNAKLPITRALEIDGGYTVQSAYYTGLNDEILSNNIYYINGGKFSGVPLHQANAGIGYNNRAGEFTARIDSYYVGAPNPFSRPALAAEFGASARTKRA